MQLNAEKKVAVEARVEEWGAWGRMWRIEGDGDANAQGGVSAGGRHRRRSRGLCRQSEEEEMAERLWVLRGTATTASEGARRSVD